LVTVTTVFQLDLQKKGIKSMHVKNQKKTNVHYVHEI